MIKKNLSFIRKNIVSKSIKIIAVTKHRSIKDIQSVVDEGVTILGENRVQELLSKHGKIEGDYTWHFIGHLQRNKVKYIIDKVNLIHSVDSLRLAEEINQQAKKINIVMDILVQVNVAEEESKYGINILDINDFLNEITKLPFISVKGLMMIAPYETDIEKLRKYFRTLKNQYDKIKNSYKEFNNIDFEYLSMGMTNDYQVAVEEGSNMVRIGRGIFEG